jgi:putative PIN family toxin of toxin-antitoxin system
MADLRIILDTNVLYAGLYSARGASYQVLQAIEAGGVRIVLSTALLFEYEDVLRRDARRLKLSVQAIDALLDALCQISEHQKVYFLWRPCLVDPKDDHLLELAVASGADRIVTHNIKHFKEAASLGVKICTPKQLLETIP